MILLPKHNEKVPVVILADGEYPVGKITAGILNGAQKVVCCDGVTLPFLAAGGKPFAIVGDCDSLDETCLEQYAEIVRCDKDQENNDLTKAVLSCLAFGLDDIVILGATGKREDHTLGNIGLLADYILYSGIKRVRMISDYGAFEAVAPRPGESLKEIYQELNRTCKVPGDVSAEFFFESVPGQQVSIFTPLPGVRITTHKLNFPLHRAYLFGLWPGTLNEAPGKSFSIEATGPAIVYRELDGLK